MRFLKRFQYAPFGAAAAVFVFSVCIKGAPSLRHDWSWPCDSQQAYDFFLNAVSGWQPGGLGSTNAYPSSYIIGLPLFAIMLASGNLAFWLYVTAIAALALVVALLARRAFALTWAGSLAVLLFLLFNPWTYCEIVAGHHTAVLACFALCILAVTAYCPRVRRGTIALTILLAFAQIQLFAAAMVYALLRARNDRRFRFGAAAGIAVALPTLIGFLLDRYGLNGIPFYQVWQRGQSIPLGDGVLLRGYFTGYDKVLPVWSTGAMYGIVAICALGAAFSRRLDAASIGIGAMLVALFASGTAGPVAPLYLYGIEHFRAFALFRELYGVLAFLLPLYVLLICMAERRTRFASYVTLVSGALLCAGWLLGGPAQFWTSRSSLPRIEIPAGARFALMPAFQPVRFKDQNGGIDPDSYVRTDGQSPLNEFLPVFPVSSALSDAQRGSFIRAANLGVTAIAYRSWYESTPGILVGQGLADLASIHASTAEHGTKVVSALPLAMTCEGVEAAVIVDGSSYCKRLATGGMTTLAPTAGVVDPRDGWVDPRWLFVAQPALAQEAGGIYTTSRAAFLVNGGEWILAHADGYFRVAPGNRILHSGRGYTWLRAPDDARMLTCLGTCVIVAVADKRPQVQLYPTLVPHGGSAQVHNVTPWLATITVPAFKGTVLRYAVAYDPGWKAFFGSSRLGHFSIDSGLNAWSLPPHNRAMKLVVVHLPSALQAVFEILGWLTTFVVLIVFLRDTRRTPSTAASSDVSSYSNVP